MQDRPEIEANLRFIRIQLEELLREEAVLTLDPQNLEGILRDKLREIYKENYPLSVELLAEQVIEIIQELYPQFSAKSEILAPVAVLIAVKIQRIGINQYFSEEFRQEQKFSQDNRKELQKEANFSSHFWDKTDRIAVMIAGGAALGSAIALLPGAVIGGVLAATYGWYISFAKPKSVRNSFK